jgi:hypothetical protein
MISVSGQMKLGSGFVFAIQCHNESGAADDADSLPTVRVYKQDGVSEPTFVSTASAAKLDDVNTLGTYYYAFTPTTTTGCWIVHISATVDSVTSVHVSTFVLGTNTIDDVHDDLETVDDYLDTEMAALLLLAQTNGVAIDWNKVVNPGSTVDLSDTAINLCDTTTTNTDMRGTDNAATEAKQDTMQTAIDGITGSLTINEPIGAGVFNSASNTLTCLGWLTLNGRRVASPTDCQIDIYDEDGTQVGSSLTSSSADAQGVFKVSGTFNLDSVAIYYGVIEIDTYVNDFAIIIL